MTDDATFEESDNPEFDVQDEVGSNILSSDVTNCARRNKRLTRGIIREPAAIWKWLLPARLE